MAENPLAHLSVDELVAEHSRQGVNTHFLSEMLRRQMIESALLSKRIARLTRWLLAFTIAIFALTAVLVWLGWRA